MIRHFIQFGKTTFSLCIWLLWCFRAIFADFLEISGDMAVELARKSKPNMDRDLTQAFERFFAQSDKRLKSIHPRQHVDYASKMSQLEDIFVGFGAKEIPYGIIARISKATGVPYPTLREWRARCLEDPSYRPYEDRNAHRRAFTREEEERIYKRLIDDYISQNKYCPSTVIRKIALEEFDFDAKTINFTGSRHWMKRFMKRWGLSFRVAHDRKRPPSIDDAVVCRFHLDVDAALQQYGRSMIVNIDETAWRVIDHNLKTVARTGCDSVQCHWNSDEKECITAICGITAAGGKLPPWIIVRGRTERSESRFRNDKTIAGYIRRGELYVTHSENGWSNGQICIQYLEWLTNFLRRPCFLIWDVFAAHRDAQVLEKARELEIGVSFIPAGMTDRYQPLDRKIFGAMKSRARSRFDAEAARVGHNPNILSAVSSLVQVWALMEQDEILKAWDHLFDFE